MRLCSLCNNKHYAIDLCKNHYQQKWVKINPEKSKEIKRREYEKNSKKYKERAKNWVKLNPEKRRKINRKWNKLNPEKRLNVMKKQIKKISNIFNITSDEYIYSLQSWSKTVRKLDNDMCKNCDSTENLHAHHIMPKSEYPELSLDLDNGVTLCEDCHEKLHGFKFHWKH